MDIESLVPGGSPSAGCLGGAAGAMNEHPVAEVFDGTLAQASGEIRDVGGNRIRRSMA
jgi:hypothetical protein